MLAEILVLAAGAVAVAVLAALQWYLSGRALKLAHSSQELSDLFANRVPSAEHLVPPFEGVKPGNLDKPDKSTSVAKGKMSDLLCDGGQCKRISRRKVPYVRGDRNLNLITRVSGIRVLCELRPTSLDQPASLSTTAR
jgi:hypothetical protein